MNERRRGMMDAAEKGTRNRTTGCVMNERGDRDKNAFHSS